MTRYAVLLRGVNVGGNNKVPMATLRELATDLGYTEVATYVQSGNLVLTAKATKPTDIEQAVAGALRSELGVDVAVMVRSRAELAEIIAANPMPDAVEDPSRYLVSFLAGAPETAKANALDREEFAPERFEVGGRCVYFWHPDGVGKSVMAKAPWDKRLGVRGTGRNWRTVVTLLD